MVGVIVKLGSSILFSWCFGFFNQAIQFIQYRH